MELLFLKAKLDKDVSLTQMTENQMAACYWLTEEALGSEDLVYNLSETLS